MLSIIALCTSHINRSRTQSLTLICHAPTASRRKETWKSYPTRWRPELGENGNRWISKFSLNNISQILPGRGQTCLLVLFRIGRKASAFQSQLPTSRIHTKSSALKKNPQNIVFLCLIRLPNTHLTDRVSRLNLTRTRKPPITSKQTRGPSRKLIKYVGRLWVRSRPGPESTRMCTQSRHQPARLFIGVASAGI